MKNKTYAIACNPNIERSLQVRLKLEAVLKKYNIFAEIIDIDSLKSGYDFVFVARAKTADCKSTDLEKVILKQISFLMSSAAGEKRKAKKNDS